VEVTKITCRWFDCSWWL